jgi:hypothetical protein
MPRSKVMPELIDGERALTFDLRPWEKTRCQVLILRNGFISSDPQAVQLGDGF